MKHLVPSITATMEEMPERHTWAGQTMVSLDILCVSIDLRVYFLCPVIIQFHPLLPQWRGYQKGTREASSSIHYRHNGGSRCQKGTREESSSIHYCHNGRDTRKAHVKHPVPSITTTMEEMPERLMWAGQTMVSLDILCVSIDLRVYFMSCYHPVPSITATMEEMPERHT